ncbi:MAG: Co2+/Mg2+ efflux protein ApaG [Chitinophagaceae bacterium]|nr:Co2+/Mg2+ efflux protein ApaG [Chitinophagaceae bacterium]
MVFEISQGVKISVETYYQPEYSNPLTGEYMFAYRITIENNNTYAVKLLRRHWNIFDSNGSYKEVDGEGVVGVLPVIQPGDQYQYVSGCNLKTEMGKMIGHYLMENLNNRQQFKAFIPEFEMIAPFKNN